MVEKGEDNGIPSLESPCCVIKEEEVLWAPHPFISPDYCPQFPPNPFTTSAPLHHSMKTQGQEGNLFSFSKNFSDSTEVETTR